MKNKPEKRSVDDVISHYRKVIHRMDQHRKIEFLLQLVGTRTAIARTYASAYNIEKEQNDENTENRGNDDD